MCKTTFQIDRPISLANAEFFKYQRSVGGGHYADLSYDVIHDVGLFVLFTFVYAKVEVIWCDTLVSKQNGVAGLLSISKTVKSFCKRWVSFP